MQNILSQNAILMHTHREVGSNSKVVHSRQQAMLEENQRENIVVLLVGQHIHALLVVKDTKEI